MSSVLKKYHYDAKLHPHTQYVGRPSRYGNPYQISKTLPRKEVIELYKKYINEILIKDPHFLDPLKGKDLVCWCHEWDGNGPNPEYCHADILLYMANK